MSKIYIALALNYLTKLANRYTKNPYWITHDFENYSTLEDDKLSLEDYQTLASRLSSSDEEEFCDQLAQYLVEESSNLEPLIETLVNMEKQVFIRINRL